MKRVLTYPDKTNGSVAAQAVRKMGNAWTREQRAELLKQGIRIISEAGVSNCGGNG